MKCKQCGDCCRHLSVKVDLKISPGVLRWLDYHGIKYKNGYIDIPIKCKFLIQTINNNSKRGKCAIYNRRPDICKKYFCWLNQTPFTEFLYNVEKKQ